MEFPDKLPVSDLSRINESYNLRRMVIAEALYLGGEKFDAIKNDVLNWRTFERQGTAGQKMRQQRLAAAVYGAPVAGFIDFLAACVFQSNPSILFQGPEDKVEWYNGLNDSLSATSHARLIQIILHGRGFMSMTEDLEGPEFTGIDFSAVIDWERDESGELEWIKTHSIDLVRLNPWEAPSIERNTWTYFCEDGMYEYVADREIRNGKPVPWDRTAMGDLETDEGEGLSMITEVCLPTNYCLMDSIASLVIGMFNREASLDFALDNSAFSFLCLFTKKALKKVVVSELQGLVLNPEDKAEWLSPDGTAFQALADRAEAMRKQLENRIQSAALNLASRDVSGRASGVAKFRDFGPISILLQFYGDILREGLEEHVSKLIELKGDTGVVTFKVMGLNEFDIQSLDSKMALVEQFMAMPAGKTAKKWAMSDLEQSILATADPEIREQAEKENEEAEMSPVPAGQEDAAQQDAAPQDPGPSGAGDKDPEPSGLDGDPQIKASIKKIDAKKIIQLHDVDPKFKEELKAGMQDKGYDGNFPVLSVAMDSLGKGASLILDGHHRSAAAKDLSLNIPSYQITEEQYRGILLSRFGGVQPDHLRELDPYIYVTPPGSKVAVPYTQLRVANDHDNGPRVKAGS